MSAFGGKADIDRQLFSQFIEPAGFRIYGAVTAMCALTFVRLRPEPG
jgi:hypothetical protein